MDSKFSLRTKQTQRNVWCIIVTIKIPKNKNAQRETAQTKNGDFKRDTKITVPLIPRRKRE
jgi:hypothetical protein